MYEIMQHCFGFDNSGGPINAYNRLVKLSKFEYSKLRQYEGAGGINIKLIFNFIKKIKKENPKLIHVRGLGNEGFHAAVAAKISGVPKILVSIHGTHRDLMNDYNPIKKWIIVNFLERLTLNIATDIVPVCESASQRDFLIPYQNKIKKYIPNGVPIPELPNINKIINLKEGLNIPSNIPIGICVSRITTEKGYLVLAKALKEIDIKDNRFVLLVVGGGDEDGSIQQAYSDLKHIKVNFVGHVTNVDEYLSISDFFIFPTFHENLSNALIEAMSYKLPVIATSVGGNTEVIEKGGGVLVYPDDVKSLSLAIEGFINNQERLLTLGAEARENIINNYSVEKMVSSWEYLYINIIEEINE